MHAHTDGSTFTKVYYVQHWFQLFYIKPILHKMPFQCVLNRYQNTRLNFEGDIVFIWAIPIEIKLSIIPRCSVRMCTWPYKRIPHSRMFSMYNTDFNYLKLQLIYIKFLLSMWGLDRKFPVVFWRWQSVSFDHYRSRLNCQASRDAMFSAHVCTGPYKWIPRSRMFFMCNIDFNYKRITAFSY